MRRRNYRQGKYRLAFSTSKYSLAFLFVLGREIEITWPGVKESSSGRRARARGIGNRPELFSLRIFYFGAEPLALAIRTSSFAQAKETRRRRWLSRSCGSLLMFLFLRNRDRRTLGSSRAAANYGCILKNRDVRAALPGRAELDEEARLCLLRCISFIFIAQCNRSLNRIIQRAPGCNDNNKKVILLRV